MTESGEIVIVTGVPRSGTSLMMQMLAAGGVPLLTDGARPADESNPRGYFELDAVKRTKRDRNWLDSAQGKAVKVIHALIPDLPLDRRYAVICMHRDMQEVVRSQRAMLERLGQPGGELTDAEFAAAFERQLAHLRNYLGGHRAFRLLEVNYRDCVERPAEVANRVAEFLGSPLDRERMRSTIDPALWRCRG